MNVTETQASKSAATRPPTLGRMSHIHWAARPSVSLLITDLDNTLWDWFRAWHLSFSAMLKRLSELSGVPTTVLESEMREVHQFRGTTEYSLLLDELPSLRAKTSAPLQAYDEALHIQNKIRKASTTLYPGVKSTLQMIKDTGAEVVAYTESIAYWTEWRIRKTGLDGLIDVLYSAPDHDFPAGVSPNTIRMQPADEYGLKRTIHRHTPPGVLKPDDLIIRQILDRHRIGASEVVYVGDSLMKDVAMAQSVGVYDVHARYGVPYEQPEYNLLRRVSHWTKEDIERERAIAAGKAVHPTRVIDSFDQILAQFTFQRR